jgi:hypothetical protein
MCSPGGKRKKILRILDKYSPPTRRHILENLNIQFVSAQLFKELPYFPWKMKILQQHLLESSNSLNSVLPAHTIFYQRENVDDITMPRSIRKGAT